MKIKINELQNLNQITYSIGDVDIKIKYNIDSEEIVIDMNQNKTCDFKKINVCENKSKKLLDDTTYNMIKELRKNPIVQDRIKNVTKDNQTCVTRNNQTCVSKVLLAKEIDTLAKEYNEKVNDFVKKEIFNEIIEKADEYSQKKEKCDKERGAISIEKIGTIDNRVDSFKTPDFRVKMIETEEDRKENNKKSSIN